MSTHLSSTTMPTPSITGLSNPVSAASDGPILLQSQSQTESESAPQSQTQTSTLISIPKTILLINGPNLNLLGYREPGIYGSTKLTDIESHLTALAASRDIRILTYQSNHEGGIVDRLHEAFWANQALKSGVAATVPGAGAAGIGSAVVVPPEPVDGIIINPGAYTHTSVAIRDALAGVSIPFVECHISNVHAREEFRHKSFLSDKAEAVIAGLGVFGYVTALEWWCWKWKGARLEDAGR